jgi:hypothetical protein
MGIARILAAALAVAAVAGCARLPFEDKTAPPKPRPPVDDGFSPVAPPAGAAAPQPAESPAAAPQPVRPPARSAWD